MLDPEDQRADLDRLRAENAGLNEQIKLLVQTEQRLGRTQSEFDRQITRIRALSEFSLEMATVHDRHKIFERATELLLEWFDVEKVAFVALDATDEVPILTVRNMRKRSIDTWDERELVDQLRNSLGWVGPAQFAEGPWERHLREAMRIGTSENLFVLPIRTHSGALLKLLIAQPATGRISAYRPPLNERSVPVLQLLGVHAERAIQNAVLKSDLAARTDELLQARKMEAIGRLAGGVAHDFNNIVTIVLGHAELLKSRLELLDEDTESTEAILQAAERATRMTSQLLALGRRQPQRLEPIDMSGLAENMVSFFRDVIGEHIELICDFEAEGSFVMADRGHLEQILLNLVVNSRDAIEGSGTIRISVSRSGSLEIEPGFVDLVVADTGIGMDASTLERVFEPFFTTKVEGEGSGLGLAIVYGLIQQAAGFIELTSAPAEGTRVFIRLPSTDQRPEVEAEARQIAPSAENATQTILLVEDEAAIRDLCLRTLEDAGYEVIPASDGVEALSATQDRVEDVELLVSDVVMPRMSGPDLLRVLRQKLPELPALFMSGYSFENMRGADVSGAPFLRKPFRPNELLAEVARLCPARTSPQD